MVLEKGGAIHGRDGGWREEWIGGWNKGREGGGKQASM